MPPQLTLAQLFGRKLRQLRREKSALEERDVEQSEVANAVGETQPNIARYEKGRFPKDEKVTRKLAALYGVSYPWLRLDEGPKYLDAEIRIADPTREPARASARPKKPASGGR